MLTLSGISSGYGRMNVLHGIDLEIRDAEFLLVTGANGAGKSTLLKTIAGFVKPSAGSIALDGAPVTSGPVARVRKTGVRLVHEGHRIFPELTVRDNLKLGVSAARPAKADGGVQARLDEVMSIFPMLESRLSQHGSDLSGGQQQILAIGQALMAKPRFLLCDEPSLGVAQALIPGILGALRDRARAGHGVVVVEQLVDLAAPYADRVVVIDRGSVVYDEPIAAYEKDPSLARSLILGGAPMTDGAQ